MLKLLDQHRKNTQKGLSSILATIVNKDGSTYRRPGAKILISEDGECAGLLSGGCFENEIVEQALEILLDEKPKLLCFDMRSSDDIIFGFGLGCKGRVWVFLEVIPEGISTTQLASYLGSTDLSQTTAVGIITYADGIFEGSTGLRFDRSEEFVLDVSAEIREKINSFRKQCISKNKSASMSFEQGNGKIELYFDIKCPPTTVHIIGAGADAIPVHNFASQLDWVVNIYDHRPVFASRKNFPKANQIVHTRPEEFSKSFIGSKNDFVVLMTHNFTLDQEYLKFFLSQDLPYIGLLGPKARGEQMLSELSLEGFRPEESRLKNFYNPVGLDLGGDRPETIALSIISQIQLLSDKGSSNHLSERESSIHDFVPFPEQESNVNAKPK